MSESEKMSAEFGIVASWSAAAAQALGPAYHVPAACRGSGGPAAMQWLLDRLPNIRNSPLLDVGAGMGGPAAFAREQHDASVVLVEPEARACEAARSLFGFVPVRASATDMPFDAASFVNAWCLGVLCTIPDHGRMLRELARVVAPGGRVGMLVYATTRQLDERPEGNHFPRLSDLDRLYADSGFDVVDQLPLAELPPPPLSWSDREQAVTDWIAQRHRDDPQWRQSHAQEAVIEALISSGAVVGRLTALARRR